VGTQNPVKTLGDEGIVMESAGDYIAIVVQLRSTADGSWYVDIEGTHNAKAIPLTPLTLVVRLRRVNNTEALRGSIRLHGSDQWVPIQSNIRFQELVRAWLVGKHTEDLGE
jgi:hypothetical protein